MKVGLRRQKLRAGAWGLLGWDALKPPRFRSASAAFIPPIVVGRKGPSTSLALLCLDCRRERHLFAEIWAARAFEVLL